MKTTTILIVASLLAVSANLACADDAKAESKKPSTPPARVVKARTTAADDLPVICHLEKRGKVITVRAGSNGPVYTVKTTGGKVLAENLSREQLRAQAPEVEEFLKSAFAGSPAKGAGAVDASLRVRAHDR